MYDISKKWKQGREVVYPKAKEMDVYDAMTSGGRLNMTEGNIRIVREVFKAFNTGDITRVSEFISPHYFNHESQIDSARGQLRGPEEFIDTVRNLRSAFADLYYQEQEIIATRDKVVSIVKVTGKHTGNFFIIPQVEIESITKQFIFIVLLMTRSWNIKQFVMTLA